MRFNSLMSIAAASAVIALAGCSANSTSAIAPSPSSAGQARTSHFASGRSTLVLPPALQARMGTPHTSNPNASFDTCPSTGTLIYMSDGSLGVVNIYDSTLTLCGQLSGFSEPQGMTVHNHNLFVANTMGLNNGAAGDILAFHRGATTPYRKFIDPSGQFPVSVTVLTDNTVVGSNIFDSTFTTGSISTWLRTGHFVGNFVPPNMAESFFVTNTDGDTIFSDGFDNINFVSAFWTMTCPSGACTGMSEVGEAMSFPGGVIDSKSGDIVASDQIGNTADTFEMPNLTPVTFTWTGAGDVDGIDSTEAFISNLYGADAGNNQVLCFTYRQSGHSPGTCGSVAGNSGGQAIGIAVDPGS